MKPPFPKLQAQYQARAEGQSEREINVGTRTAASEPLMNALQAAAMLLCVNRYGGKVVRDLQNWGFDVTAASSAGTASKPAETATAGTGTGGTATPPA